MEHLDYCAFNRTCERTVPRSAQKVTSSPQAGGPVLFLLGRAEKSHCSPAKWGIGNRAGPYAYRFPAWQLQRALVS